MDNWNPEPVLFPNGRIGWPLVFVYRVETSTDPIRSRLGTADFALIPWRPTFQSHPAPDDFYQKRNNDTTPVRFKPASLPWELVIYDLAIYESLERQGALRDERHAGSKYVGIVDERKASQ